MGLGPGRRQRPGLCRLRRLERQRGRNAVGAMDGQALHGQGQRDLHGGPAGNASAPDQLTAIIKVFANYPAIHLLTGNTSWPVTNWDPTDGGDGHRVASVASSRSSTASSPTTAPTRSRALSSSRRPVASSCRSRRLTPTALVPVPVEEDPADDDLLAQTGSAHRGPQGDCRGGGLPNNEPNIINLPAFENTLAGKTYQCNRRLRRTSIPPTSSPCADRAQFGSTQLGKHRWMLPPSFSACGTSSRRFRASSRSRRVV